jgi:hypothetical protein
VEGHGAVSSEDTSGGPTPEKNGEMPCILVPSGAKIGPEDTPKSQEGQGGNPPTRVEPIRSEWGNYMLHPKWRKWALDELGVGEDPIEVDLFASPGMTAAPLFITKDMDAFAYSWELLMSHENGLLWANPPFKILGQVVKKIGQDKCRVAICTPEWRDEEWWQELEKMTPYVVRMPPRTRLYYGAYRQAPLPQKWWRTVVWFVDTTCQKGESTEKKVPHLGSSLKTREDLLQELRSLRNEQYSDLAKTWEHIESVPPHETTHEAHPEPPMEMPPIDREIHIRGGIKVIGKEKSHTPLPDLESHLRICVTLAIHGQGICQAQALIDTGAEVCLIKTGLLPKEAFHEAERPLRLIAANNQKLQGGTLETAIEIGMDATDVEGKTKVILMTPSNLYEADIEEDVILSYQWLGEREFEVNSRRHGLSITGAQRKLWIPGIRTAPLPRKNARLPKQPIFVRTTKNEGETRPRALDLFCGRKSVAHVLEKWGFEVVTMDNDPSRNPTHCVDIMEWDYTTYPKGYFDIVAASPPCTEYSAAKTKGVRKLDEADAIVQRTLEIIEYLEPPRWWVETPKNGMLARRDFMQKYPYIDVDYCCFEECGYQKPTRFFGSPHLGQMVPISCDGQSCPSLLPGPPKKKGGPKKHRWSKGGREGRVYREMAYMIPEGVIEYVAGLVQEPATFGPQEIRDPNEQSQMATIMGENDDYIHTLEEVKLMNISSFPTVSFEEGQPEWEEQDEVIEEVAKRCIQINRDIKTLKTGPETIEKVESDLAETLRDALMKEFGETSLSGKYMPNPPKRGPFGEAEIWLKPDAKPVSVPPYHIAGERRDALLDLVEKAREMGKLEDGKGPWNTPAFPVPKKTPGTYRLVQDLRPQNAATVKDGHPLPRIGEIVQRQGKFKVWTTLDLVDGFHQMPMREEHRHITCMSTPRPKGTQQWTVLVMGLKNAGTQFQRMMEWVLRDHPSADPYIDDVIIGSDGETEEQALRTNYEAVRAVMQRFAEEKLVCSGPKSEFFQKEVQFCGHILREGRRSPAPGKLLPLQLWELPKTVTELRGFLGLTNYFSEYVHHYAEAAAPLMGKLKLNRQDGKKGSKLRLKWTSEEEEAFTKLKARMCENMELCQVNLDKPFTLRCDASDYAIGAELQQEVDNKWRPVALYSRKLTKSQLNWVPREKETYAIVAALIKWAGLIGFQPVVVTTDHRSLDN